MKVKVQIMDRVAVVTDRATGALLMTVPADRVRCRFERGARALVGVFSATLAPDGTLELGDREPTELS